METLKKIVIFSVGTGLPPKLSFVKRLFAGKPAPAVDLVRVFFEVSRGVSSR
jgi:hypothetical protein